MAEKLFFQTYSLLLLPIALTWLRSGTTKILSGTFPDGLEKTLGFFASKNPYSWYKNILEATAIPNAKFYGTLIMWTEFLVGITLLSSLLYIWIKKPNRPAFLFTIAALTGGVMLNLLFWLAAGWTSASSDGINLLMLSIEVIGIISAWRILHSLRLS